jgi:serine/threonine-protein kinase
VSGLQKEIEQLKLTARQPSTPPAFLNQPSAPVYEAEPASAGVSKTTFVVLLLLTIGLAAFSAYTYFSRPGNNNTEQSTSSTTANTVVPSDTANNDLPSSNATVDLEEQKRQQEIDNKRRADSLKQVQKARALAKQRADSIAAANAGEETTEDDTPTPQGNNKGVQYMVISKAYFYSKPDGSTRRNAFVVPSNNAVLTALDEQNDFVYVVFTNTAGETSKGWLQKQDLQRLND